MSSIRTSNRISLEKASMNIKNVFNHGNRGGVKIRAAALFMNRRTVGRRNTYGTQSLIKSEKNTFINSNTGYYETSRFNVDRRS